MLDLHATLTPIGETTMPKITTEEEALAAVRQDGFALQHMSESLKAPEVCLEAVRQQGRALQYVPPNLKTTEICLEAVKNLLEKDLEIVPEALCDEVRARLKSGAFVKKDLL